MSYLCGMMKRWMICVCAWMGLLSLQAQEVRTGSGQNGEKPEKAISIPDTVHVVTQPMMAQPFWESEDSLHLPPLSTNGKVMLGWHNPYYFHYPYYFHGGYAWKLHQGLNVSLGASVFAQFGKHARHGAGFAQNVSALYAAPLTKDKKLSLAVGGFLTNLNWGHTYAREAGVTAILGYQFNEHWEAYVYGQKSLVGSSTAAYPLYEIGQMGDRIGAAVVYNFNPSFSMGVSVEYGRYPQGDDRYKEPYFPPSER